MILNLLLFFVVVILLVFLIYSIKKNIEAGNQLILYDNFFNASLSDVQEVIEYLDKLSKRDLVSQDPDVINLRKTILTLRDLLKGYSQGSLYENIEEKTSK